VYTVLPETRQRLDNIICARMPFLSNLSCPTTVCYKWCRQCIPLLSPAYQQIRMYDVHSSEPTPVYVFEGMSKNVSCLGFYENGHFMYSGGEDCTARIWDLRWASDTIIHVYM